LKKTCPRCPRSAKDPQSPCLIMQTLHSLRTVQRPISTTPY